MRRYLWLTAVVLVAGFAGGCSEPVSEVSGIVLIDGQPLAEGEILFEAADARTTPAAGPIRDGKYTVRIVPGSKKVQIKASRPTAKPDPVMGTAARESMIPPEFNTQTRLTAELKPGRQQDVNFEVKSLAR